MAPIMSFTAEQISDHYQKNKKQSIHLQEFANLEKITTMLVQQSDERWEMLRSIRSAVLKAIEGLREQGIIKHSLEAKVTMNVDQGSAFAHQFNDLCSQLKQTPQGVTGFFEEFFIVSLVEIVPDKSGLTESEYPGLLLAVEKAPGEKCPRCWKWTITTHPHALCDRCAKVIGS